MTTNKKYENEIFAATKSANNANHFIASLRSIQKKYHTSERVLKTFANGLTKIGVYDKNDVLLTVYHDVAKKM